MVLENLRKHWNNLIQNVCSNTDTTDQIFVELTTWYSQSHRFYHTLAHILQVLETIEAQQKKAGNFQAIQFAAWFHDAVYDPQASDNEEQSAAIATSRLALFQIPDAQITKISDLILCTKTHQAEDQDAQILLDADLSILNAEPTQYWNYARSIRQEYAWVPDEAYRVGRQAVLEKFLRRWEQGTLYFEPQSDQQVGINLREEIQYLAENF